MTAGRTAPAAAARMTRTAVERRESAVSSIADETITRCCKLLRLIAGKSRLQYIDWLRGLAVVLMIQVHATNSFLDERFQGTVWYDLSQFLGGLAAPLFLFTSGISIAIVFDRLVEKGATRPQLIERTFRRAAWIFLLA